MNAEAKKLLEESGLLDKGWSNLAKNLAEAPMQDAVKSPEAELAMAYARVSKTADGQKVFEHLHSVTHGRSSWWPGGSPTMEQCTAYGLLREGQNGLFEMMQELVRKGGRLLDQGKKKSRNK